MAALASTALLVVVGTITAGPGEQGKKEPNLVWNDEFDGTALGLDGP